MKMLIFVIVLALVAVAVLWKVRKADAERELARQEEMKRKQKQRKEAIVPEENMIWPVIIKPGGKDPVQVDEKQAEPSMTTIEFVPAKRASSQN